MWGKWLRDRKTRAGRLGDGMPVARNVTRRATVRLGRPQMNNFNSFAENVNSQYGEDGIIREILQFVLRL